jgi:NAD(P)-dependent dehydrogenase (short-subunit alcohol dehydrogenase family)
MGMRRISFDGQVVIVTGGGAGLGRSFALEFGRRGASVVVVDPGGAVDGTGASTAVADEVVAEIVRAGGKAAACYEPVGTPESGQRIVAAALDAFGRLDVVVNNAGINRPSLFHDTTVEEYEALIATHLTGHFWTSQAAYRHMKHNGGGRFVFITSSAAIFGNQERGAYGSAKGGLFGLSNVIALEGGEYGIRSNAMMPMAVTRMVGARRTPVPALTEALTTLRPRLEPEFVAPLVVYLASDACSATGGLYSAAASRYARAVVGVPRGWAPATAEVPSVEELAEHWAEIEAHDGPIEQPGSTIGELLSVARQLDA